MILASILALLRRHKGSDVTENGVIFIAAGEAYVRAANRAAQSIREHVSSIAIDLFTDDSTAAADIFDQIHPIDAPHARSKVDYLHRTRFQRTLYLDTDIRVVADISEMFDILDRFDIAIAHAHARNRKETKAIWHFQIPDAFPQMNGGVLLFRSSPTVLELLRAWQRAYHSAGYEKDQVTLRELLWLSDLRLHILPPEYNIRYERYLSFWEAREAVPRILHFQKYHRHQAKKRNLPERRKELMSRLIQDIRRTILPKAPSADK